MAGRCAGLTWSLNSFVIKVVTRRRRLGRVPRRALVLVPYRRTHHLKK